MDRKPDVNRLRKENYPISFEHRTLYADMDAFRHLNNGAIGRFFEEGRSELNMRVFGPEVMTEPPQGLQLLFASVTIDFLKQAHYPGTVEIASAVTRIGTSSWNVAQAGFQNSQCFALTTATMVKAVNGRSEPLSVDEKALLTELLFRSE